MERPADDGLPLAIILAWGLLFIPLGFGCMQAGCCMFLVWPAVLVMVLKLTDRLQAQGFCTRCGYDLRGSGARCPECGLVDAPATDRDI